MRLFGLIGYPLSHSFSQKYFTEKFEKEKIIDCQYLNFPISSMDQFESILNQNPRLEGLNVTIPYKEKVISYLHQMSDVVKSIGACNCIKIENGRLAGYSTDVIGFERSFVRNLQSWHKHALVLGTGGSSKAVQYVLSKLSIPFQVVSRAPTANEISYAEINENTIDQYKVIINTTPLGMQPHTNTYPSLPYASLSKEHYLFDLIYNPAKTGFLELGEQRGATIQNGHDMLIFQAEESWQIWNS
jgi:shikimate dehydrogenase